MKRSDFEAGLASVGLNLAVYRDACYQGGGARWTLSLAPYPAEEIKEAKLAIRTASTAERAVLVDSFFAAAKLAKNSQIDAALHGLEYRGVQGSKNITIASFEDELFVNVLE